MIYIVYYRISLVKELECVKCKETEYKAKRMINNCSLSVTSLDYNVLARN
jgi:hypothetical protein